MKNIYKSFALLCIGLAAVACIEENFEENTPKYDTTPGNEIVFSATAGIENGMPEPETKTVYGDKDNPNAEKGWIEINWENGDMVQIVSPEAAGPEVGHYRVVGADQNSGFNQTHQSASLTKLGDAALQWSESDDYTFYGVYPSFAYDSDNNHGATASLTKDGLFTGSMPIDQNYTLNDNGSAANGWIAAPDMKYAFMTASDTYKRAPEGETDNRRPEEKAINLEFKSMVTAFQFDIKPGEILYKDPVTNNTVTEMEVISVSLLSSKVNPEQNGKSLSGSFNYNIPNGEYSSVQGTRMVSLHFDNKSVKLSSGGASLNVTLFILPEDFDSTDKLQLQIIFKLGATQVSRIATINTSNPERPILGGKKYIFNNVQLPPLKTDVVSSSWWDTLDPDTILPQISIPVASNVFASNYYGTSETKNQQQSLTIDQLWAMGVRGFEICNQSAAQGGTGAQFDGGTGLYNNQSSNATKIVDAAKRNLGPCRVVAAESFVGQNQNMTFHSAFHELCRLLSNTSAKNECLIILCTYMSVNDGYCPYTYVANLINYLEWYCTVFPNRYVTAEDFRIIDSQTTVGDLRGKVSIIIRPGDDERWLAENSNLTRPSDVLGSLDGSLTEMIPTALDNSTDMAATWSKWKDKVMFISDWGAASFDVWDRRYGSEYARSARFDQQAIEEGIKSNADAKRYIEDYLYGISNGRQTMSAGRPSASYDYVGNNFNDFNNYGKDPVSMPNYKTFNFEHIMSNNKKAYVQEWARVIKDRINIPIANRGYGGIFNRNYYTLWVDWPTSLDEKKTAIKDLFEKSVKTRNTTSVVASSTSQDLYINVLSGYFADFSVSEPGTYPHKDPMDGFTKNDELLEDNGDVRNHGKGGDYQGLAEVLNDYVYKLLSREPGSTNALSQEGPWGLVMLDHINNEDVSEDLVNLIMMNNFKFPLVTKCKVCGQAPCICPPTEEGISKSYNATYSNGGEAISFE